MCNAEQINIPNSRSPKSKAAVQLFEATLHMSDGSTRKIVYSRMLSVGKVVCFTTFDGMETFSTDTFYMMTDISLASEITRVTTKSVLGPTADGLKAA